MKNFLLFCSGAKRDLLKLCPTEEGKYVGLGGAVLTTSVMAALSCASALMMALHLTPNAAWSCGLLWGTAIFNLDRWLVSSARRQKTFRREVIAALPRIGMALLFGAIISEPLVLTVFAPEINSQLARNQAAARQAAQERADANPRYRQIDALKAANAELGRQLSERRAQRDAVYQAYLEEAEGKSGTGIVGKGPVFREKGERLARTEDELRAFQREIKAEIARNQARIGLLQAQKDRELRVLDEREGKATGLLARMAALHQLTARNPVLWGAHLLFALFIMTVDCLPVLAKLMQSMNPRRPYDALVEAEEDRALAQARILSEDARGSADVEIGILQDQHGLRRQMESANSQRLMQRIADVQYALADEIISAWEDQERQNIRDNVAAYIGTG